MGTEMATPSNAVLTDGELLNDMRSLKKWSLAGVILLAAAFPIAFALLAIFSVNDMIGIGFASGLGELVLALAIGLYAHKRSVKLKVTLGNALTLPVIKEIFEVKDYRPLGHISREIIGSAGLIDRWETISGSDYIEGSYNGVSILYSDLLLQHTETETNSDGEEEERTVTDFKGQWLVCDFNKELAATIRLIERKGGTKWQRKYDVSKSDIETENIAFNKKFRIVTGDGHTAFYLLTPHFMEQLVAADEAADSSTLFCFKDGKVHIALYNGRDSFELKGVKLDSVDSVRQKFRRELKYMTDIMDELLRNDRLFKQV